MSQQVLRKIAEKHIKNLPPINVGQTVKVHQIIQEGSKQRIQAFDGLIIKVQGSGVGKTITVRKIVDGIGVEKIFPVHSQTVQKIEILKTARIRRAKLYYMRKRSGKSARLVEKHMSKRELEKLENSMKKKGKKGKIGEVVKKVVDEESEKKENAPVDIPKKDEVDIVEKKTEEKVETVDETKSDTKNDTTDQ